MTEKRIVLTARQSGKTAQMLQAAYDENYLLRQRLAKSEARVAELEEGLHGIANCAYGYNHPKAQTADEAASWMNGEAMRLLGDPQPKAYVLRKQAEAVEAIEEKYRPHGLMKSYTAFAVAENLQAEAKQLRQQADELENTK